MDDVFTIRINTGDAVKDFATLKEASSEIASNFKKASDSASGLLPDDVKQFFSASKSSVSESFDRIKKLDKQIKSDSFNSDYERTNAINERAFHVNNISAIMQDVAEMQKIGQALSTSRELISTVGDILPTFYAIAQDATKVFKGVRQASDRQLINQIKIRSDYKELLSSRGLQEGADLDNLLEYAVLRSVPQVHRGTFLGRMSNNSGAQHIYDSFKSMLPTAFRNYDYHNMGNRQTFGQQDNVLLSPGERSKLAQMIQDSVYMAEAAEIAGIAKRENGYMHIRDKITRGSVKAMGGNMMPELINAAKGMPMYGITDVDDQEAWGRIARKGSKRFLGNLGGMRKLNDSFGWMEAINVSQADQRAYADAIPGGYKRDGRITFSPKTNQYEVAMYTIDDVEKGRNWNDGKQYKNAADYHHMTVDDSLHLRNVMGHSKQGMRAHNSYLDDVIYLDIDEALKDPTADPAIREAVLKKYSKIFNEGIRPGGQGERYVFSRINPKTGIEFVKESIKDSIDQEDPTYFSAGLGQTKFNTWKDFASAMEYRNKNATPGQNIANLFGSRQVQKLRVVDIKDTSRIDPNTGAQLGPGLDGASIIATSLVPTGFQGRAHGIKTALLSMDIGAFADAYDNNLRLTAYTNDPNEKGKTVSIDKDTDLIINAADLKNADLRFAGMSNAQIEAKVLADIQKYGIYAARTYDDANGKTSWMSGQMAQLLRMDPQANQVFAKAWMDEFLRVGTPTGAADILFGKNDERHDLLMKDPGYFNDPGVQSQIREYRQAMLSRMSRGDIFLGHDLNAYRAMIAPWMVDAVNADMKANGAWNNLSPETQAKMDSLTMGQDRALFTRTMATKFGIGRYPATTRSLQTVSNLSHSKDFVDFANAIGLDPNALYLSPQARVLDFLQDADFDGDVGELIELAGGKNGSVAQIMDKVFDMSLAYQHQLVKRGKISQEQLEARKAVISKMRYSDKPRDINNPDDQVEFLKAMADAGFLMGAPNGVIRNAYQLDMNDEVIQAIMDAEIQYSTNSAMKHGRYTETTNPERAVLGKYKPFSEFYHMIDKARDENGHIDYSKLADKSLFSINLPSANMSSSMRSTMLARFMAKQMGVDINENYNWEDIFNKMEGPVDTSTALGRMKAALRNVDIGMLNADYLMPSDRMVAVLQALRQSAIEEETLNIQDERRRGLLSPEDMRRRDSTLAAARVNRNGGTVISNLLDYALTQEASSKPENQQLLAQLGIIGRGSMTLFGNTDLSSLMTETDREQLEKNKEARILAERAKQSERINGLANLDSDQFSQKIDALRWSPSMLFELINGDVKWADKRLNGNYDGYDDSNIYSIMGNAAHAAIQLFMDRRKNAPSGKLSDEELLKASSDALEFYNKYLNNELTPEQKGDRAPRNFTEAEIKDINNPKRTAYRTANSVRQFLSHGILGVFPEDEWEVIGVEAGLGDYVDMGKQKTKDDKVKVSANTDALFRNRKTGEVVGTDWKAYNDNLTAEELRRSYIQNMIYASGIAPYLKDLGLEGKLSSFQTINPVTGKTDVFSASDAEIQEVMGKVQNVIEYAHQILPDESMGDVLTRLHLLSGFAKETLGFTPTATQEAERAAARDAKINATTAQLAGNTGTAFGGAMMLHDEYTHAMKMVQDVSKFAYGHTPGSDQGYSGNIWEAQYNNINRQKLLLEELRREGMNAQANTLEGSMNAATQQLDYLLPIAALNESQEMSNRLDDILNDRQASKHAGGLVEYFENITSSIAHAQDAYTQLINKIVGNNERIAQIDAQLNGEVNDETRAKLSAERRDLVMKNQTFQAGADAADQTVAGLKQKEDAFKEKIINDTYKELEMNLANLTARRDGTAMQNISEVDKNLEAYKKSVNTQIADMRLYAQKFGLDTESQQYKDLINGFLSLLSDESIGQAKNTFNQNYQKTLSHALTMADYQNMQKSNNLAQQLRQDRSQYDMSRIQYGPTIIGRSWQYNDQQYAQWANRQSSWNQQMLNEQANIANLKYARDVADQKGDTAKVAALDKNIAAATSRLQDYKAGIEQANAAMHEFSSAGGLMRTSLINASNALEGLLLQLGRRALMATFKEATNFIRQFNADMIQIQAITGKSNEDMQGIRASSIAQAQKLKTSVKNVTSTKSALYRQGLSDAEVEERTDAIVKFSTVTGAKVTDATKGLTTAIQTGLVSSITEAMDVLAALGDSAATTAEEIEKGMQKAAASAKVAGVSYKELASMLTIATSKTQLGGAQAGTFFQTLFSRMNRVTKEGYLTDESGETTNINDVEAALKTAGITLRESKTTFRNSFDVLRDVAKVWEGLSDLQKGNITYAMAGGRQANMFNTLMAGMGEDGGKLLDEYLGLAENSEGTVQSKYEITIQSIQAALDNLKSTFDGFVETLGSDNMFTNLLNTVSGVVEGLSNFNNAGQSAISVMGLLGAAVTALIAKMVLFGALKTSVFSGPVAGIVSTVAALGAGAAIMDMVGSAGKHNVQTITPEEASQQSQEEQNAGLAKQFTRKQNTAKDSIEDIKKIASAYKDLNELSAADSKKLTSAVANLTAIFPSLASSINQANTELSQYVDLANQAAKYTNDMTSQDASMLYERTRGQLKDQMEQANDEFNNNPKTSVFDNSWINEYVPLDSAMYKDDKLSTSAVEGALYDNPRFPYLYRFKKALDTKYVHAALGNLFREGLITDDTWSAARDSESATVDELQQFLEENYLQSLTTPEGILHAIELSADEKNLYSHPLLTTALNAYLSNDTITDKGAFSGILSYADLLDTHMWERSPEQNSVYNSEAMLDALTLFLQDLDNQESHTRELIEAGNQEAIAQRKSSMRNILSESVGSILTLASEGDESVTDALIDNYFEQYPDEWYKFANADEYIKSIVSNTNGLKYRFFEPTSKMFKYSLRDKEGNGIFGFDSLDLDDIKESFSLFSPYMTKEQDNALFEYSKDGFLDFDKIINASVNNLTNLPARPTIAELANSVAVTSKSKGYINEYGQLSAMLAASGGDLDKFFESTKKADNVQKVLENDSKLGEIITALANSDETAYTQQYLAEYLFAKALGADSFGSYMQKLTEDAIKIADQQQVMAHSPEEIKGSNALLGEIAKTLGTSLTEVTTNFDSAYKLYVTDYMSNRTQYLIDAEQNVGKLISTYLKENKGMQDKSLEEIIQTNPQLQSLVNAYRMHGVEFDLVDGIVQAIAPNGIYATQENPLLNDQAYYPTSYLNNVATALLQSTNWQATSRLYENEPGLLEAVGKQFPTLSKYLQMTDSQKNSRDGQMILKEIQDNIKTSELPNQVATGIISQGIADTLKTMLTSVDSAEISAALASGTNEVSETMKLFNAMQRIGSKDKVLPDDYATIASAFNIEDENVVRNWQEEDRLMRMQDVILRRSKAIRGANRLRSASSSTNQSILDKALADVGLTWNPETGAYESIEGFATSGAATSTQFNRALGAAQTRYNPASDYAKAYNMLRARYNDENGASEYNLTGFVDEIMSTFSPNFWLELLNTNFTDLFSNNKGFELASLFTQGAYGINAYNPLYNDYTNAKAKRYYDALLAGNGDVLQELEGNQTLMDVMRNWVDGWDDLMAQVIDGKALTTGQKNDVRAGLVQRQLGSTYALKPWNYDYSIISGAPNLYGTRQQQLDYINSLYSTAATYKTERSTLAAELDKPEYARSLEAIKDIAKQVGMNELDIQGLTISNDSIQKVSDNLETAVDTASNAMNEAANACSEFTDSINSAKDAMNEESNGWNLDQMYSWVSGASGLANADWRKEQIMRLSDLAQQSANGNEFMAALTAQMNTPGSGFEWAKNEESFKEFVSDQAIAPILYRMFQRDGDKLLQENGQYVLASDADYEMMKASLWNASAYSGLGYDPMYAARMGRLDSMVSGMPGSFMSQALSGTMDIDSLRTQLAMPMNEDIKSFFTSLEDGSTILAQIMEGGEGATSALHQLAILLANEGLKSTKKYNDNTDELTKTLANLGKDAKTAGKTAGQLANQINDAYNAATLASKIRGKAGKQIDKKSASYLNKVLGLDEGTIRSAAKETVDSWADQAQQIADQDITQAMQPVFADVYNSLLEASGGNETIAIDRFVQMFVKPSGEIDMSAINEYVAQNLSELDQSLASLGGQQGEFSVDVDQNGTNLIWKSKYASSLSGLLSAITGKSLGGGSGGNYHGGGGGGGGGGKSAADKLLQNLKNKITLRDHRIQMTQLQEEKYHQLGMLGNENNMIEYENTLQQEKASTLAENITAIRKQLKVTERGSDDWQKLYEQVLKYEEELDKTNNTITANTIKMLENSSAIRKSRTDLEDLVVQEIEARIQKQREMLAASVEMQDMVVDAIRQRYQDEWDLITKDLEKKREALEEEKSLIDKRLQARKDAQDEAEKYEELAEYRRQLALISMDSTRTKDAAALREKIADLENELAWKTAEDEAEAQKESLDSQLQGLDKYQQYGDEDLQLLLEDANNFSSEVSEVMQMNQADMFDWLKNNVKDYANSLKDAQTQMVQSWEDTYKQMLGITDTYWDQVDEILSSKNNFAEFMMASDTFKNASETQKQELLYQWLDAITSGSYIYYTHAQQNWATYSHDDDEFADYNGGSSGGSDGNTGGPTKTKDKDTTNNTSDTWWGVYDDKGKLVKRFETKARAEAYLNMIAYNDGYFVAPIGKPKPTASTSSNHPSLVSATPYAEGGDVNYTGLAMVHGTPARPEAFLDAEDRANMRAILDSGFMVSMRNMVASFEKLDTSRYIPHIFGDDMYTSDAKVTVGDINISTETINDEADFELLAKKIGQEFIKDLSMQGIGTNKFSF